MIDQKKGTLFIFDKTWNVTTIKSSSLGEGIEIDFTRMYSIPDEFSFKNLVALSEFFGTLDIDWEGVSEHGCETCGWGSNYGFEIQIYKITKNYDQIKWEGHKEKN